MPIAQTLLAFLLLITLLASLGCAATSAQGHREASERKQFAIAIHGGAGVIPRDTPPEQRDAYIASLTAALQQGKDLLASGRPAIEVVEHVVRILEDDPLFNAGRGAVYTESGTHELDASIMDGSTLSAGAVAGVTTVRNPITLARHVMNDSRHVLLAGNGAEHFATRMGVERVDPSFFNTPNRYEALQRALQRRSQAQGEEPAMGTVGCVALDINGNLAAATSTGGMTAKRWGRIGDSPIIGAGTYANNATCAISCTGTGEEFIRHSIAFSIHAQMLHTDAALDQAANRAIFETLAPGDGGLIAVDRYGNIAMPFSSGGMFRGAANAAGLFEVRIWDEN